MKILSTAVIAAAGLTLLGACATPTPYAPANPASTSRYKPGYTETRLEENRYRLSFAGNDITPRETVENYMLYRAAELTLDAGYDWFEVVNRDTDEHRRAVTDYGDPFYGGLSWRFYRGSRWSAWGAWSPFDNERETVEYTRYEATAEIVLHKGPKADVPNAYDARSVQSNLAPSIRRPGTAQ